jgi:hypothetical protein
MPPPSSFVDITAIPYSRVITPTEFNVANEFWFRLIIGSVANEIVFSERNTNPNIFVNLYQSDGTTLISRFKPSTWTFWKFTVGTYYIKLDTFPIGPIGANFTYNAESKPLNGFVTEPGSVLIQYDNNDADHPSIVIDSDGNVTGFASAIPSTEIGTALANGYQLYHDRFGKYGTVHALILINPDLTFNLKIIPSTPFTAFPRITHSNTDFYALNWSNGQLWKITTAGVITLVTTIAEVAAEDVDPIGMNSDGTILYFGLDNDLGTIRKYVIAGGVTTTLYAIPGFDSTDRLSQTPDSHPGEIIVLPDGSLVTWWEDNSANEQRIIHLSAAGALLNSIVFAEPIRIDHIDYFNTVLSTHVKIRVFLDFGNTQSRIGNLNLATGVIEDSYIVDSFSGAQNTTSNNNPFGPAESCTVTVLFPPGDGGEGGGGEEGGDGSGLYFLEPNESVGGRHDKYIDRSVSPITPGILAKKIPNPTIRTALFGE